MYVVSMSIQFHELWSSVLSELTNTINKHSFDTLFTPTRAIAYSEADHLLTIEVPSRFFSDWLTEHYFSLLENITSKVAQQPISIKFVVSSSLQTKPREAAAALPAQNRDTYSKTTTSFDSNPSHIPSVTPLNPKYTFNSFVEGNSNRFARAASLAVAEAPAKSYNPLFLYGGVGLGKTHLLHAIGNFINQMNPDKRVVYVSSEAFMNDMISSIGSGTMRAFRDRFRTVDVLLIDDIQFLVGKESTQEEFFHTFNDLYNVHKQIVATSDSHPKEINLE